MTYELTYEDYYYLFGEALDHKSLDMFVAEYATSIIFDPGPDSEGPDYDKVVSDLTNIWDISHMSIADVISASNLCQTAFARRFLIPLRTVQAWALGERECPIYTKLMLADLLGLVTVDRH